MTAATKAAAAKAEIYVAWQGGSVDQWSWSKGTRLRADHPAVKRMGAAAFVPDGTPQSEWPSALAPAIEMVDAETEAALKLAAKNVKPSAIKPTTPIGELRIARVGITASKAGTIEPGVVVHESDRRVSIAPEAFKPLIATLRIEG